MNQTDFSSRSPRKNFETTYKVAYHQFFKDPDLNKHDAQWSPPIWVLSLGAGLAPFAVTLVAPAIPAMAIDLMNVAGCFCVFLRQRFIQGEKEGEAFWQLRNSVPTAVDEAGPEDRTTSVLSLVTTTRSTRKTHARVG